jgi:hypothetical protein
MTVAGRAGADRRRPAADRPAAPAARPNRGQRAAHPVWHDPGGGRGTAGRPAAVIVDMHPAAPTEKRGYRWLRRWKAEGAAVEVMFFEDGRVMAAGGGRRSRPGPHARLRSLLGW